MVKIEEGYELSCVDCPDMKPPKQDLKTAIAEIVCSNCEEQTNRNGVCSEEVWSKECGYLDKIHSLYMKWFAKFLDKNKLKNSDSKIDDYLNSNAIHNDVIKQLKKKLRRP